MEATTGYVRIGELSRRSGVSTELLRAWERRYGLLRPTRSEGGFRLYRLRTSNGWPSCATTSSEGCQPHRLPA